MFYYNLKDKDGNILFADANLNSVIRYYSTNRTTATHYTLVLTDDMNRVIYTAHESLPDLNSDAVRKVFFLDK